MKRYDYMELSEWLEEQMRGKETFDVEFKSAAGGFPASFWETYSSFANTEGGTIVLGIKEKDDEFFLDNLTEKQVAQYEKSFWSDVNNRNKVSHNLLTNNDVRHVMLDSHHILLFYIPRAPREMRPVFCTLNPDNGTYKRDNEGDFKCTPLEVRRMFADANVSTPADSRILENYTIDDIDKISLRQFRQLFDVAKPGHAWQVLDDINLLKKLGGYRTDRKSGKEGFTLAGILMFGKSDSITDDECAPFFFPDYRELPEMPNFRDRWIDRICADGTWEANLFQFYRRVLAKLYEAVPVPFQLDGDMRKDETSAHVALREAFVNTLVHADYSINSSIVITRSREKITFENPGTMLVSKQQYYDGGTSVCRNTSLQKMFMMLGRAEKAGSGADTIIAGWTSANKLTPDITENIRPDKVTLTLSMVSLIDDATIQELKKCLGKSVENMEKDQLMVLALALKEGRISNERLHFTLTLHPYDITKMLRTMCKDGLLNSHGKGRGTYYTLSNVSLTASGAKCNTSDAKCNTSGAKCNTSGAKCNTSGAKCNTSGAKCNTSGTKCNTSVRIALPKRCKKEDLQKVVVEVASDWVSVEVISKITGRGMQYVKGRIIPEMLQMGLIERLYPGIPHHPAQKYRRKV